MQILEASPRSYDIKEAGRQPAQWSQQNLAIMYPRGQPAFEVPTPGADGRITEARAPDGLREALAPIETLFEAKAYAEAEKGYEGLLRRYPGNYALTLSWGDAALFQGKADVALERYRAAQKLNPLDHRAHFFEATALFRLDKPKAALDALARALTRRPHAEFVLTALEGRSESLGITVRESPFLPKVRVTGDEQSYSVEVLEPRWLAWGLCKAVWLGEPSARTIKRPEGPHRITLEEERECLVNLLGVYLTDKTRTAQPDAQLEALVRVQKAGLLDAFIVYELLARGEPSITLATNDAGRAAVERYIKTFVFEPW
jgi:tetratricopeptide (TPR) repeat protein